MGRHLRKNMRLISAFVDDELESGARRFLEEHLRSCAACREVAEDFKQMKQVAATSPRYPASPYFLTRLKAHLEAKAQANGGAAAIEAKLLVPMFGLLILALTLLFSFMNRETSEGYLFYSIPQQTVVEEQLLLRQTPFSKDEVLVLAVSDHRGEE